ncbi:MAG: polysaccharide biosynthesis/export family protein [Hyphomicrobiaceae bacterium]
MRWRHCFVPTALAIALSGCAHVDEWASEARFAPERQESWRTEVASADGAGADGSREVLVHDVVMPVKIHGPQAVADTDGPYLLDTGDKLRIFVYGQPNLSRIYTVDHEGSLSIPLIGRVSARGLTTYALEKRITSRLGARYVRDPEVTVDIAQNRPFFILGEVRNAGQYPYVNGMTVRSAIAIAGGFSDRANQRVVQITRRINGIVEKLDVPEDYIVKPGDTLLIYERFL